MANNPDLSNSSFAPVHVIGAGLAGSEAAWQIALSGVPVVLHEMRPVRQTEVHRVGAIRRTRLLQFLPGR